MCLVLQAYSMEIKVFRNKKPDKKPLKTGESCNSAFFFEARAFITHLTQPQLRRSEMILDSTQEFVQPRRGVMSSLRDLGIFRRNSIIVPSLRDCLLCNISSLITLRGTARFILRYDAT